MTTEQSSPECVICYETLQKTNVCVTPCGHTFCFNCMMKHTQQNKDCPCCRTVLIESSEDVDDSDDEDYEEEDVESIQDDDEDDETEETYPIEKLVEAFVAKGYDLKDALSLLMYRFSKTDEKYTKTYIQTLEMDIEDLNEELQNEHDERVRMAEEEEQHLEVIASLD